MERNRLGRVGAGEGADGLVLPDVVDPDRTVEVDHLELEGDVSRRAAGAADHALVVQPDRNVAVGQDSGPDLVRNVAYWQVHYRFSGSCLAHSNDSLNSLCHWIVASLTGEADAHLAERVLRDRDRVLVLEDGLRVLRDVPHVVAHDQRAGRDRPCSATTAELCQSSSTNGWQRDNIKARPRLTDRHLGVLLDQGDAAVASLASILATRYRADEQHAVATDSRSAKGMQQDSDAAALEGAEDAEFEVAHSMSCQWPGPAKGWREVP